MDFSELKKKALELKDSAVKYGNETLDKTANKLKDSSLVIKDLAELNKFVSENKHTLVIFWKSETEFYKKSILTFPVLFAKGWANNYKIKMYDVVDFDSVKDNYKLEELPSMLIIEQGDIVEVVKWDENIMKVVKNLSLEVEWVIKK